MSHFPADINSGKYDSIPNSSENRKVKTLLVTDSKVSDTIRIPERINIHRIIPKPERSRPERCHMHKGRLGRKAVEINGKVFFKCESCYLESLKKAEVKNYLETRFTTNPSPDIAERPLSDFTKSRIPISKNPLLIKSEDLKDQLFRVFNSEPVIIKVKPTGPAVLTLTNCPKCKKSKLDLTCRCSYDEL